MHGGLEKFKNLGGAFEHARREDVGVPRFDRDDGAVQVGELGGEEEKLRFARLAVPGGVEHDQIDFLVAGFAPGLHGVLANLAHEKAVLLEILADNSFVDGGHAARERGKRAGLNPKMSPGGFPVPGGFAISRVAGAGRRAPWRPGPCRRGRP